MNALSGTKELIFDTFVEMVSSLGYENVSIRDIAAKVGIKPASLYNHFESKGKMLEYVYNYYSERQYETREHIDVMKKLIETTGADEIINAFACSFETDDRKKYFRMTLIAKIIYMRLFQDPIANAIFDEMNKNTAEYVINILRHGVDAGRIDPDFDIETFAELLIGVMQAMGIKAFAFECYAEGQPEQEKRIKAMLARLLSTGLK